jgi:Aspartyl protease
MKHWMKVAIFAAIAGARIVSGQTVTAPEISCHSDAKFPSDGKVLDVVAKRTSDGIIIPVRVNGSATTFWFIFDTGAGRTVLDRAAATSLGLKPTSHGSISGVGSGRVPVDIVSSQSLTIGDLRLGQVDLRLASIGNPDDSGDRADGIIGYDLLCTTVVRVDFSVPRMTIVDPHAFSPPSDAENLPIAVRNGWMFVRGTIKVAGKAPVSDEFLLDSGSEDAVNHPVIRESKGPLQQTRTGAGGFGSSQPGVIGPNEWFELGHTRIPSTLSACCAATPEISRQIGLGVLGHFVITFDYLNSRVYVQDK